MDSRSFISSVLIFLDIKSGSAGEEVVLLNLERRIGHMENCWYTRRCDGLLVPTMQELSLVVPY